MPFADRYYPDRLWGTERIPNPQFRRATEHASALGRNVSSAEWNGGYGIRFHAQRGRGCRAIRLVNRIWLAAIRPSTLRKLDYRDARYIR